MPFFKGLDGEPLKLYRGECNHPGYDYPKSFPRAMYFGDLETAHAYSEYDKTSGDYYTSRIYPVHLILERPFVNQPGDPFLCMSWVAQLLGKSEARRIAIRFAKYVEETDNWQYSLNLDDKWPSVAAYVNSDSDAVLNLYFQAHRFFDSLMEVGRLRKVGFDGAIHGGSGTGSAGKAEYCVFSRNQVFSTTSKSFLSK